MATAWGHWFSTNFPFVFWSANPATAYIASHVKVPYAGKFVPLITCPQADVRRKWWPLETMGFRSKYVFVSICFAQKPNNLKAYNAYFLIRYVHVSTCVFQKLRRSTKTHHQHCDSDSDWHRSGDQQTLVVCKYNRSSYSWKQHPIVRLVRKYGCVWNWRIPPKCKVNTGTYQPTNPIRFSQIHIFPWHCPVARTTCTVSRWHISRLVLSQMLGDLSWNLEGFGHGTLSAYPI